jgi:hypothetical protein
VAGRRWAATFGLFTEYVAYRAMRLTDNYCNHLLISFAVVMGTHALADKLLRFLRTQSICASAIESGLIDSVILPHLKMAMVAGTDR